MAKPLTDKERKHLAKTAAGRRAIREFDKGAELLSKKRVVKGESIKAPEKKKTTKKVTSKKSPSKAKEAGGTIKKGQFGTGSTRRLGEFGL